MGPSLQRQRSRLALVHQWWGHTTRHSDLWSLTQQLPVVRPPDVKSNETTAPPPVLSYHRLCPPPQVGVESEAIAKQPGPLQLQHLKEREIVTADGNQAQRGGRQWTGGREVLRGKYMEHGNSQPLEIFTSSTPAYHWSPSHLHFARDCSRVVNEYGHGDIFEESHDHLPDIFRGKVRLDIEQSLIDQHVGVGGQLVAQPAYRPKGEAGLVRTSRHTFTLQHQQIFLPFVFSSSFFFFF